MRSASRCVDLSVTVGSVTLPNPVMLASGTAGHGAELSHYLDLGSLGAVVVKSLSPSPYAGNPSPRVHGATGGGMLNSVGLQNPGVDAWLDDELPALVATGARVVASIWGSTVDDYAKAAAVLASAAPRSVIAVECNVSCPNVEDRRRMFAHSVSATSEAVAAAVEGLGGSFPLWAKLSPNVTDITEIAGAALTAGADALTLVNTVMGMGIDTEQRAPTLGAGGGGLSGPPVHPVAVRAVYDCRAAHPGCAIVGVGGVSTGELAIELIMAGANAVQIGTATFAEPRASARILKELARWCESHGVERIAELTGVAHATA